MRAGDLAECSTYGSHGWAFARHAGRVDGGRGTSRTRASTLIYNIKRELRVAQVACVAGLRKPKQGGFLETGKGRPRGGGDSRERSKTEFTRWRFGLAALRRPLGPAEHK